LALGQSHGTKLRGFLAKKEIKPYINKDLAMALEEPLRFIRPGRGGKPALAYEATLLVDICDPLRAYSLTDFRACSILGVAFR